MTGLAAATIATIATGAAIGTAAVALARRRDGALAWNLVAAVAVGGVIAGYGLLARLLCTGGAACSSSRPDVALAMGGVVVAVALALLVREARR